MDEPQEPLREDAHESSGRGTESNARPSQDTTSGTVSHAAAFLAASPSAGSPLASSTPLASQITTLAQVYQPRAQTSTTSRSTTLGSVDAVSLLHHQLQPTISDHHLQIATTQAQQAMPAGAPSILQAQRLDHLGSLLSQNTAVGRLSQLDAQTPRTALPLHTPGSYFPAHHTSAPPNHTEQLLQLLYPQESTAPMRRATPTPRQQDRSQLLHQLLGEIRFRIEAVTMILSQEHQESGSNTPMDIVTDDTIDNIIAMLCEQHQAGVHNNPSSDSEALQQIAAILMSSSSPESGSMQPSTSSRNMASANNSTAFNQHPSTASGSNIQQGAEMSATVAGAPEASATLSKIESKEERWMARYGELKEFQKINGHCRVPHGYKDNRKLSWWVMNQRAQFQLIRQGKTSWLSEDRVKLLKEIGFSWSPAITGKEQNKKQEG